MTELSAGVDGTAGCGSTAQGAICTPTGSPFNLENEANDQVLVGFTFSGTASDGMGDTSAVNGTFSTTLSNTNIAAIIAALDSGSAIVSSAQGTIAVTATPEPSSMVMISLGSLLLASSFSYRRRRR